MTAWRIEHDNDTGPDDEGFAEWWTVTDGTRAFRTDSKQDAEWLLEQMPRIRELVFDESGELKLI